MRPILLALLVLACNKAGASTADAAPTAATATPRTSATVATPAPPSPESTGIYTPATPKTLADFMPPELEGVKLEQFTSTDPMMALPAHRYAGAYLNQATRKSININIGKTLDLATSRAQFHKLKPGQKKDAPAAHLAFEGFEVQGFPVERTQYLGTTKKSEANVLIGDKVDVMVSVQPADDPDESIEIVKRLDLHAIEAFAKTL